MKRKLKLIRSLTIFLMVVGVLMSICSFSAMADANVEVLSHTGYLDSSGYYHAVGEVQNIGNQAANLVNIEAEFYDSNNVSIASRLGSAWLNTILPGRKSPFDIRLSDATQSSKVDHCRVNVTYSTTSPIAEGLEILSSSAIADESGLQITGNISNVGDSTANYVQVIATCLDKNGEVGAAVFTNLYPEGGGMLPGDTVQFDMSISDVNLTRQVHTCELTAESSEYECVQEQTIKVQSADTMIALLLSPNSATPGQTVLLSGTLTDVNNNPIYPAQVKVENSTDNGTTWLTYGTLDVNSSGQFSTTFSSGVGTYVFRVSYAGNATYNPSNQTQTLIISVIFEFSTAALLVFFAVASASLAIARKKINARVSKNAKKTKQKNTVLNVLWTHPLRS